MSEAETREQAEIAIRYRGRFRLLQSLFVTDPAVDKILQAWDKSKSSLTKAEAETIRAEVADADEPA